MRRAVIGAACAAAVAIGLFFTFALTGRFVLHGPVNETSLATSVRTAAGSSMSRTPGERCHQSTAALWTCTVLDREGSGTVTYRVRRHSDSSCWHGDLAVSRAEGPMPERIHGCVHAWQWSIWDLV